MKRASRKQQKKRKFISNVYTRKQTTEITEAHNESASSKKLSSKKHIIDDENDSGFPLNF